MCAGEWKAPLWLFMHRNEGLISPLRGRTLVPPYFYFFYLPSRNSPNSVNMMRTDNLHKPYVQVVQICQVRWVKEAVWRSPWWLQWAQILSWDLFTVCLCSVFCIFPCGINHEWNNKVVFTAAVLLTKDYTVFDRWWDFHHLIHKLTASVGRPAGPPRCAAEIWSNIWFDVFYKRKVFMKQLWLSSTSVTNTAGLTLHDKEVL